MAAAVDASSPARFTGTGVPAYGVTSASFTNPADSLIVVTVQINTSTPASAVVMSVSDSVDGTTGWTEQVRRDSNETTDGGFSSIWTAIRTSSDSRTITVTWTSGGGSSGTAANNRISCKAYAVTGADIGGTPVDSVTAANEGGSTTNNLNTTNVTPGATGLLFASDTDWNALGVFDASSNLTQDSADDAGRCSFCSGYRTCSSGVAVSANLNAAGASAAQHKWCQIVVREAAGGGGGGSSPIVPAGGAEAVLPMWEQCGIL